MVDKAVKAEAKVVKAVRAVNKVARVVKVEKAARVAKVDAADSKAAVKVAIGKIVFALSTTRTLSVRVVDRLSYLPCSLLIFRSQIRHSFAPIRT